MTRNLDLERMIYVVCLHGGKQSPSQPQHLTPVFCYKLRRNHGHSDSHAVLRAILIYYDQSQTSNQVSEALNQSPVVPSIFLQVISEADRSTYRNFVALHSRLLCLMLVNSVRAALRSRSTKKGKKKKNQKRIIFYDPGLHHRGWGYAKQKETSLRSQKK